MRPPAISDRDWLWLQFAGGLVYLIILAVILGLVVDADIPTTFAVLLVGATTATVLGLKWLTLWARRADSRLGQFQIGSLLFFTAFAAMFFGAVRWTAAGLLTQRGAPVGSIAIFVGVTLAWLLIVAISLPVMLGAAEAVLWAGVWAIRQPVVRRGIRLLHSKSNDKPDDSTAPHEKPAAVELHGESLRG